MVCLVYLDAHTGPEVLLPATLCSVLGGVALDIGEQGVGNHAGSGWAEDAIRAS